MIAALPVTRLRGLVARCIPEQYRALAQDTAIYATGGLLIRSVSFFLVPILTRALTAERFGALDVLTTAQGLVALLIGMNLDTGVARYYYECESREERVRLISTVLWLVAATGTLAVILVAAASNPFSRLLFGTDRYAGAVILAALCVPPMSVGTIGLLIFRYDRRPADYIAATFLGSLVQLIAVFVAVTYVGAGVHGVLAAQLIAQMAMTAAVIARNRAYIAPVISRDVLRPLLRFSLPMLPSVFISWALSSSSRFFLLGFASLAAVASFAVASKISMVMQAALQAFSLAWLPFAMSIMKRDDASRIYARAMYAVVSILSLIVVVAAIGGRAFVKYYAGAPYAAAGTLAAVLMLGTCLSQGFGMFFSIGLMIKERSIDISSAQAVTLLVNIALNVALVPRFHEHGAGWAFVGASLAQVMALGYASGRVYPFRYSRLVWAAPAVAAAAIPLGIAYF